MEKWLIAPIALIVIFVALLIRNRRSRAVYADIEREFSEVLAGRFTGSRVMRRKFVRALAHYGYSDGGVKYALPMFQDIQARSGDLGDQAACLLMTGMCLEEMNNPDGAMRAYDSVCASLPDFKLGHIKRAHLLSKLGKPESVDAYKTIVEKYPDDAIQRNNYASALIRQNQCEEAIIQLKKALALDNNLHSARGMLALAYARLEDFYESEQAFEDAVAHGESAVELREILNAEYSKA